MSFTYFAIMEDLDKNVFFVSELGTYLQCRVYTLIVDVNVDRISYLRHRAFIHFNIHTLDTSIYYLHPAQDPGWPGPVFTITDSICGFSFHTAQHS